MRQHRGAFQPASAFTLRQLQLLADLDSGALMGRRNAAVNESGHGRLYNKHGQMMDSGGSTGGVSRRIIDSWTPPDPDAFLKKQREDWIP